MKIRKGIIFVLLTLLSFGVFADSTQSLLNEKPLPALPADLSGYAIGSSNDAIIYAGGKKALGITSDKAYVLPKGAQEWKTFELKDSFANAAFTSDKKALYVVGGNSNPKAVRKINWDGEKVIEKELTPLPKEMPGAGIATDGKTLYILGSGSPNFLSLSLISKKTPEWKAQPDCPLKGITDPCLVMQKPHTGASQLVMISEKIDGKPSNNAWNYRPTPTDGLNGAMIDQGWHKIACPSISLLPNTASPSGQSNIVAYQNGKVLSYNLIMDVWDETASLTNKVTSDVAIPFNKGALVIPTKADLNSIYASFSITAHPLGWIDWTVILVYLAGMLAVGAYFMRREKTTDDYFMGGHKIPWWGAALSLYATGTSAISYMAIPTMHMATNLIYTFTPTIVGLFVTIFITAKYMIPIIRKMRITTSYEYLKIRFNGSLRYLGSFLQIGFQLGGRMSVVLLLPSIAIAAVTGLDPLICIAIMGVVTVVYTTMGGLSAVVWTDAIQVIVMIGGAILALIMLIAHTHGGFGGFVSINMDYDKFRLVDWSFNLKAPVIWIFIVAAILNSANIINDQTMIQRALATPSVKAAKKSVIGMQAIILPANFLFAILGFAIFAYYHSNPVAMSPAMSNQQAFPLFIVQGLPVGVTGLILAGLFAASMSTLSSSINSTATMIVNDFYKNIFKNATDKQCLTLGKWLTCILGLVGTGAAMYMYSLDISSIFAIWNKLLALFGGGIIGIFALGLFTKKANAYGAWGGTIASLIITWYVQIAGLPINAMVYTPMSIVSCIIFGYIISILTGGSKEENLENTTIYTIDFKAADEAK